MTNPSQAQIDALIRLYYTGQTARAEQACKELLEIYPNSFTGITLLGAVFQKQGKLQEALQAFDKAIEMNPDSADSYNSRGGVLTDIGQFDKAIESYNRAIEINPGFVAVHCNLSALKTYKPDDAQITLMDDLFRDSKSSESDRRHLCFALAKAYEDLGEFDKSFNYLKHGNHLCKKELNYSIEDDRRMVAKIRDYFVTNRPALDAASDINTSIEPVFVVGMPRSGTSLVEQILASHTKVHGAGELDAMVKLVNPILSKQGQCNVSQNAISSVRDGYLEALATLNVPEKIIIDKMPLNFLLIGFILSAFPAAKIINLNRDPRATCWSIFKHYFSSKGHGYAYDQLDIAAFHEIYIDMMSFWRERYSDNIYDLYYESLTENQEHETRKLLDFCNLEWEEQCLDFHKTQRIVNTPSATQVRQKMYKNSSEAWKKYEKHLHPLISGLE